MKGEMRLNEYGRTVLRVWDELPENKRNQRPVVPMDATELSPRGGKTKAHRGVGERD